jgi:hypothetical protein
VPRRSDSAGAGLATLVVGAAVTRIDALAAIALAVDSHVAGSGTVWAHVPLSRGERAYVEIPKFGEPPPFAIDVVSDIGPQEARTAALELLIALGNATPWRIRPTFATAADDAGPED